MANPIHRFNIVDKDKRSQRKVADSTTELDKTERTGRPGQQKPTAEAAERPALCFAAPL